MEFMKPEEVGKILNVSGRTAKKLGEAGVLPGAMRVGGQWRFRKDLLMEWIERQTQPEAKLETSLPTEKVKG